MWLPLPQPFPKGGGISVRLTGRGGLPSDGRILGAASGVWRASRWGTDAGPCRATCRGVLPVCDMRLQQESARPARGLIAVADLGVVQTPRSHRSSRACAGSPFARSPGPGIKGRSGWRGVLLHLAGTGPRARTQTVQAPCSLGPGMSNTRQRWMPSSLQARSKRRVSRSRRHAPSAVGCCAWNGWTTVISVRRMLDATGGCTSARFGWRRKPSSEP